MILRIYIFLVLILLFPQQLRAQQYSFLNPVPAEKMRPMTTERPSKNVSSYIIDAGHFQVETTLYSLTRDSNKSKRTKQQSSFNSTTLRLGVTQSSEISVVLPSIIWQRSRDISDATSSNIRSRDDFLLRFKKNIFGGDPSKNGVSLALMPYLKIPTAGKNLGNNAYEQGLKTHYDHKFDQYSFSYLFDVSQVKKTNNTGRTALVGNVMDLGKSFTSDLYAYCEFSSYKSLEQKTAAKNYVDFGVIYQLTKNTTIDLVTNFGVSQAADDFNLITGFAHRF